MDEFEKVTKRPPIIPNLLKNNDLNNNQLISNLQKNNVILNNSRRCSTGLLFEVPVPNKYNQTKLTNKQLSSFRQLKKLNRLQNLHFESVGLGLNGLNSSPNQNVYNQNLKLGLLLRSSLPTTPISTPLHSEFFPFTEQLLLDRLSRTPPMQRKQWNNNVRVYDSSFKRNSESNASLNRHLDNHLLPANKVRSDFDNNHTSASKVKGDSANKDLDLENLSENDINVNSIFKKMNKKTDLNNKRL